MPNRNRNLLWLLTGWSSEFRFSYADTSFHIHYPISKNGQMIDMAKTGFHLEGRNVIVQGRFCRVAQVDGEGYKFLADPKSGIAALRDFAPRADLFTFFPELPETSPLYPYPFEWDNLAVR